MKTNILSLATANPGLYVTQEEAFATFCERFPLAPREQELYRRILIDGAIRGRHVGMDSTAEAVEEDQDRLVQRFLTHGRKIATEAARKALAAAGLEPAEVAGIIVNTCTGYLCPGLSSYVAGDLGLPPSVRPMDLMGMGCGAALPNLQAADNMTRTNGGRPVLSIAVEICSATLFMDPDPGVVVSNCIFGDGAAAAVVQGLDDDDPRGLLTLVDFESGLFPKYRPYLQYRTEKHRLRNVLTLEVPVIGGKTVAEVAGRLLERQGLGLDGLQHWIVHPGGTEVLRQVQKKFHLAPSALQSSYEIFQQYGNMSSPSVLFVLKHTVEERKPRRGERGVMLAFGAGFTAFAALVEFK